MTTNTKEWIQYSTASLMIISGVVLTFLSFFIYGDVVDGVLWYMAQGLTYAGGVFGVSLYFRTKLGDAETRLKDYFDSKLRIDREKDTHNEE